VLQKLGRSEILNISRHESTNINACLTWVTHYNRLLHAFVGFTQNLLMALLSDNLPWLTSPPFKYQLTYPVTWHKNATHCDKRDGM